MPPEPFRSSVWPETFAFTVPEAPFENVRPPLPMTPSPWIVLVELVSVKLPPDCSTNALPLWSPYDSVTVPSPVSVTLLLNCRLELVPEPPVTVRAPSLEIEAPNTVRLLLRPTFSMLSGPRVRFRTFPPAPGPRLTMVGAAKLPFWMKASVMPVGTPGEVPPPQFEPVL